MRRTVIALFVGANLAAAMLAPGNLLAQPVPADSVPAGSVPPDSAPSNSVPGNSVPGNSVPGNSVPAGSIPAGSIPAGSVPADRAEAEQAPGEEARPSESPIAENVKQETESAKTKKKKSKLSVEVGGRLFLRENVTQSSVAGMDRTLHNREISSARTFVEVVKDKVLSAIIEVEFGDGDADIKDVYATIKMKHGLRLRAGHFKRAISLIGLESVWNLPTFDRGLLSEISLENGTDLPFAGGRAMGVELRWKLPSQTIFTLAAFQTQFSSEDAPLDASDNFDQDVMARVEQQLGSVVLAASAAWVGWPENLALVSTYRHRMLGSLEAFADWKNLRVWLEGFAGQELAFSTLQQSSGSFWAARGIVAPRLDVCDKHKIEPYVTGAIWQPSSDVDDAEISELVAGLGWRIGKSLRISAEGGHRFASDAAILGDQTFFRVQLGTTFREMFEGGKL